MIQTPNYGRDYPANTECVWDLIAIDGYNIQVQFTDRFYIEDARNCENDYLEVNTSARNLYMKRISGVCMLTNYINTSILISLLLDFVCRLYKVLWVFTSNASVLPCIEFIFNSIHSSISSANLTYVHSLFNPLNTFLRIFSISTSTFELYLLWVWRLLLMGIIIDCV